MIGIIVIVLLVLCVLYGVSIYNALVSLKNNIDNAFADIDVQMKLRFDLIENLVNTVKGYAKHEKETLENLTEARTKFLSASSHEGKIQADGMLSGALKSLFAVSENYPDLKADANFRHLQTELSDIENKIAAVRRFFNSTIKEYNTSLQIFPNSFIAGMFGFKQERGYFEITNEAEKAVPKVQF